MSKEEKIKQLLCDILDEITIHTDKIFRFGETESGNVTYMPMLRDIPMFVFTEEDIKLIRDLADELVENFSKLTDINID